MALLHCVPGLATGANNGSSLADAYQTWAAAMTAVSAGDTIRVPWGTYNTGETLNINKAGTSYTSRITITAGTTDGSRNLTTEEMISQNKKVVIDGSSSMSNGVHATLFDFVSTYGIDVINTTSHGWLFDTNIGYDFVMCGGGAGNCTGNGVNGNTYARGMHVCGCNFRNFTDIAIICDDALMVSHSIFKNARIAVRATDYMDLSKNVFDSCGGFYTVYCTRPGAKMENNVFYNCTNGAIFTSDYVSIKFNRFVNTTNECINLSAGADDGVHIIGNAYYNNGSKYVVNGSIGLLLNEIDMTGHGMINPAGGNYMSDPATDEARIQHYIDSINSAYTTGGLPPEIGSGGGTQYHFRPGQARGPVTH
jgi:hypothetical protein